jgi:hypothetical protein
LYYTNLFIKKKDGGQILKEDPALAEWSVNAISLVRLQLNRASNGQVSLPFYENWIDNCHKNPTDNGGDVGFGVGIDEQNENLVDSLSVGVDYSKPGKLQESTRYSRRQLPSWTAFDCKTLQRNSSSEEHLEQMKGMDELIKN